MQKAKTFLHSSASNNFLATFVLFFVLTLGNTARGFVYDASHYWSGAYSILLGTNPIDSGWLQVRGLLSSVVYLPAVFITNLFGQAFAGYAVMFENALIIAVLGALIVPSFLAHFKVFGRKYVWISSLITGVCFFGFVPYPLMDIWAVTLFLAGILCLLNGSKTSTVLAGVALGIAINIRPAYLIPVIAVVVVWSIWSLRRFLFFSIGFLVGIAPQFLFNISNGLGFTAWPRDSFSIAATQSTFAAFIVRYDTVPFDLERGAAQFFCSPQMSERVLGDTPTTTLGVLGTFVSYLPESIKFIAQKWSSLFFWSTDTPYLAASMQRINVLGLFVIFIIACGIVGHAFFLLKRKPFLEKKNEILLLTATLSVLATLALSTPEARFSLPLVVIGIIGFLLLLKAISNYEQIPRRVQIISFSSVAILCLVIFTAGYTGLQYPAPPGLVSPEICLQSTT